MILRVLICRCHRPMAEGCSVDWYPPNSAMSEWEFGGGSFGILKGWMCIPMNHHFRGREDDKFDRCLHFLPPESRAWGGLEFSGCPRMQERGTGPVRQGRRKSPWGCCYWTAYCHGRGPHLLGCLRGSRSHGSQDVCFEGNIMFGGQDPKQYQIGVLCLLYLIP